MDGDLLAGLELLLVLGVVLGLGIAELISLRRANQRAREAARRDAADRRST
jgi:hypothetical protein